MSEQILHIGFRNYILGERVIAILGAEGNSMKRLRDKAHQEGKLVDMTRGRKAHATILTDSGHIFLSTLYPDTLISRLKKIKGGEFEMPLKRCQRENEQGWKWGDDGFCYLASEEGSDNAARDKALAQGRAIEANQNQEDNTNTTPN